MAQRVKADQRPTEAAHERRCAGRRVAGVDSAATGPASPASSGGPNAGKSTLTNALVGQKVAITSTQAADHAARHPRDRAPARRPAGPRRHPGPAQAAHPARASGSTTWSGETLARGRRRSGSACPPTSGSGPATGSSPCSWPSSQRRSTRTPVVAIATKADLVDRDRLAEHLVAVDQAAAIGRTSGAGAPAGHAATRSTCCATC